MNTSQKAVVLFDCGVKADMTVCRKNCVLSYLSALENAWAFKGDLQMSIFTFFTFYFKEGEQTIASAVQVPTPNRSGNRRLTKAFISLYTARLIQHPGAR